MDGLIGDAVKNVFRNFIFIKSSYFNPYIPFRRKKLEGYLGELLGL
jgi:hypothetical protein